MIRAATLALLIAGSAHANPVASKAALDALFAMPAAAYEGVSTTAPPGFDAENADQQALIDYLAARRKEGARLDQYRMQGTLLHHSLRVSFNALTKWLLAQDADPLQRLEGEGDEAQRLDALGVAVRLGRWNWVTQLHKHPAYQKLASEELAARAWLGVQDSAQVNAMLKQQPAFPLPLASSPAGQTLLRMALCGRRLDLLERLAPATLPAPQCQGLPRPAASNADLAAWRALEARLNVPLLPFALHGVASEAELKSWLGAGLRMPWTDKTFAQASLVALPVEQLPALLRHEALWPQLPPHFWNALLRGKDWAELLKAVPPANWGEGPLYALAFGEGLDTGPRWSVLSERLRGLPDAQRQRIKPPPALLRRLPPERVPEWLAAFGAETQAELLAYWVSEVRLEQLQALWPQLKRIAPEASAGLLDALLAPIAAEPAPSTVARKSKACCGTPYNTLPKARFLLTQLPKPAPRELAMAWVPHGPGKVDESGGEGLAAWALKQGLVTIPAAARVPAPKAIRRVSAPLACQIQSSAALRRALMQMAGRMGDDAPLLQALAEPGQPICHWLSSESTSGGSMSYDEEDFFEGVRHFNPCGDGSQMLRLWDMGQGRFVDLSDTQRVPLFEVELQPGGERFWLSLESPAGRCGTGPGEAFRLGWREHRPQFEPVPENDVLQWRWQTLCSPTDISQCLGLQSESGLATSEPRDPQTVAAWADRLWAADKRMFLSAFERLDRPALGNALNEGLFPHWLEEAVKGLNASPRPLPERRSRMAWLQAQFKGHPERAQALSDESLRALAAWLPAEDWTPLLNARRCNRRWFLEDLARQPQLTAALKRRIDSALAEVCVEGSS